MGIKSKKPKVGRPFSAKMLVARILAGVPIRVIVPPNRDENESGIKSFETGILVCFATLTTAGNNIAVAPTLFIKADIRPQVSIMTVIRRISLFPESRKMNFPRISATPVLNNPPETI